MSFCRHQLLRAPAQRLFSALSTTRRVAHRAALPESSTAPFQRHARFSASPFVHVRDDIQTVDPELDTHDNFAPDRSPKTANRKCNDDPAPSSADSRRGPMSGALGEAFQKDPIAAYCAMRDHSKGVGVELQARHAGRIAHAAVKADRRDVIQFLVEDAVRLCATNRMQGHAVVFELFDLPLWNRVLTKKQVLLLVRALHKPGELLHIPFRPRICLTNALLRYPPDPKVDEELYGLLVPFFMRALPASDRKVDLGNNERSSPVPGIVWPLYQLAQALAVANNRTLASSIFAGLVDAGYVDPSAIDATDLTSQDYVYIVTSVLTRSSIAYGWQSRAVSLLSAAVSGQDRIPLPLAQLCEEWLLTSLVYPDKTLLVKAAAVLIELFKRADNYVLPERLLQKFYEATVQNRQKDALRDAYRASLSVKGHSHLPPCRGQLTSLMEHLVGTREVHLARVLATHVANEPSDCLDPADRSEFILTVVTLGFLGPARTLWERYSVGPDSVFVKGRRGLMLRIVSAFLKTETLTRKAATRCSADDTVGLRINLLDEDIQTTLQETRSHAPDEDDHPTSDAPHSLSPPPPHGAANAVPPPSPDDAGPPAPVEDVTATRGGRSGFAALTREELLARADDLRGFADRVFDAFHKTTLPLETTRHYDLNAIARGAFMLGRDALAFEAFSAMRQRGIRSTTADLNVILWAVAKSDPAAGLARLRKMIDGGLHPDEISFGTVIHWAIVHGEGALVAETMRAARAHGLPRFSFKTLGRLLHAAVSGEIDGESDPAARLAHARAVVRTMARAGQRPTANMGRDCVRAALAARDPAQAFAFWQQLVQGKVQHDDAVWRKLADAVARQVSEHRDRGWLDDARARAMLAALGWRGPAVFEALRRVRAQRERVGRIGDEARAVARAGPEAGGNGARMPASSDAWQDAALEPGVADAGPSRGAQGRRARGGAQTRTRAD